MEIIPIVPKYTIQHFNRCIFVDASGRTSVDFMSLALQQKRLTFDGRFLDKTFQAVTETPFLEIRHADPLQYCSHDFLIEDVFSDDQYEYFLDSFITVLRDILMRLDPNEAYLFSCSAGSDSRIFSALMAQLRNEGLQSFDNVLFHCWGSPEKECFLQLMNKLGWRNVSVIDDSVPDPLDAGLETPCVDGWYPYINQIRFWGERDPSRYILLSGAEGETLLRTFDEWIFSYGFFSDRGESVHRLARHFKGIVFPYLTHEMLKVTMRAPKSWKNVADSRLGRDKIRTDLAARLGVDDIPIPKSFYTFNFSEERKELMLASYNKSQFKIKFGIEIAADALFSAPGGYESKLWSFAVTVYEKLYQQGVRFTDHDGLSPAAGA